MLDHLQCAFQDVSGGKPVLVGSDMGLPLYGMEVDVVAAAAELRALGKDDNGERIDKFLAGVGLGAFSEQLRDLRLGEPTSPNCGVDQDSVMTSRQKCLLQCLTGAAMSAHLSCAKDGLHAANLLKTSQKK